MDIINTAMPEKTVKRCSNDKPWVTDEFRHLVDRRNRAFKDKSTTYPYLRNKANKLRKRLRKNYYTEKIRDTTVGGRNWWHGVKEVTGMGNKTSGMKGLINTLCAGDVEQFGEMVNQFFHSISADFAPLQDEHYTPGPHQVPSEYIITVEQVEERLALLDPRKSSGPDGIPTWVLRNFAPLLSGPVCAIFNSSIRDSSLPLVWKSAIIVPIPKCNPPKTVEKDLRPISLTPVLAKELEYFVCRWVMDLAGHRLDPFQYGAIHKSSTVHALVDIMHDWSVATDSTNTMVRALLLDYRKAFDLIDHHVLLEKIKHLKLPSFVMSWIAAFLHNRRQQVRIGSHVSGWLPVHGGVPQGTRIGPITFLFMVNDLLEGHRRAKFVDDTMTWDCCDVSAEDSKIQAIAQETAAWSGVNKMQLNVDKTKEMVITFSRSAREIPPIIIEGRELERITSTKILGVVVSCDLTWGNHVQYICSRASKRLYFMCMLKRAGATCEQLVTFYKSTIRSCLEYACPVWHCGLTGEQADCIEGIQRRALRIAHPELPYEEALMLAGLDTLNARRERLARSFFVNMLAPGHKLNHLIPEPRELGYGLRRANKYPLPRLHTQRAKKTLVNHGLCHWQ